MYSCYSFCSACSSYIVYTFSRTPKNHILHKLSSQLWTDCSLYFCMLIRGSVVCRCLDILVTVSKTLKKIDLTCVCCLFPSFLDCADLQDRDEKSFQGCCQEKGLLKKKKKLKLHLFLKQAALWSTQVSRITFFSLISELEEIWELWVWRTGSQRCHHHSQRWRLYDFHLK